MRDAVAIIGSGARFPGARDLGAFRRMVASGSVHTKPVPEERWDHATVHSENPRHANKTPAQAGAFIDDIELFAPEFFGVTPKRARLMDPQQRLMLEIARQALEDAGYARRVLAEGRTGVYVGASSQDHRIWISGAVHGPVSLAGHSGVAAGVTAEDQAALFAGLPAMSAYTITSAQLNMIAANVSQAFDFRGPAFAIDTACSSALAALHEAVAHLRAGMVDAALVGGVYTMLDPTMMVCFSRIGALSATDRCAPFQAEANGFVLGEGAGAVVLKRLADAQRDGDRVMAVIRGVAMNNDGRGQGPLTPSAAGQVEVMRAAWRDAGCEPATAGLLEAHATATQAGDACELTALTEVFGGGASVPVTSIKANIGHGLSSAGIASLLKAACAVESGVIFPQPVSGRLRDELAKPGAGLRVPTKPEAWTTRAGEPRRAGVSAFGFGGTNVHVVLEEPPAGAARVVRSGPSRVVISAPNRELLASHAGELARAVRESGAAACDVAYTLARRRREAVRVDFEAANTEELSARLEQVARGETPPPVAMSETEVDGRLVSLPPSPLVQRRFWLIDKTKVARAKTMRTGAHGNEAETTVSGRDTLAVVVASVCAVTAWQAGEVTPERRFVADLGFDSLTTLELMTVLGRSLPGMTPPPRTLFTPSLTVGELAKWIADAPVQAKASEDTGPGVVFTLKDHPWLHEHRPGGRRLMPLAAMLEAARRLTGAPALRDFQVSGPVDVTGDRAGLNVEGHELFTLRTDTGRIAATGRTVRDERTQLLLAREVTRTGAMGLGTFYAEFGFHGPALQALAGVPRVGEASVEGEIAVAGGAVAILDGALQLALYWLAETRQRTALVTGFADYGQAREWPGQGVVHCTARLTSEGAEAVRGDFDFTDEHGALLAQWRGVEAKVLAGMAGSATRAGSLPEVRELAERKAALARAGFAMPYFQEHDGVAGATTRIAGREFINFSSYNYLGLAGHPEVNRAATEAVARYGTSASASRVASGERPLHGELERELAAFLGCGDALVMVSGHATNVSLIGHLLGPEDLIIHDSLAHDSIMMGARLSGARRLAFAHNDTQALAALLAAERPKARRVLIAVEGVYSMDGDLAPLPEIVALKKRHDAMLLVDEAHSLGVLGETGAGVGEHFGVARGDVDLWMGTLSKSLASCGGYVAGDAELIDYLRFTMPGFLYSVGLAPANAAAALAALRLMRAQPERVARLRGRAEYFRQKCREAGVDIGASTESAVVPCITGASEKALRLAQTLGDSGVNVQPIFYPAVEEGRARLRFFVTSDHTEEQLARVAAALGRHLVPVAAAEVLRT